MVHPVLQEFARVSRQMHRKAPTVLKFDGNARFLAHSLMAGKPGLAKNVEISTLDYLVLSGCHSKSSRFRYLLTEIAEKPAENSFCPNISGVIKQKQPKTLRSSLRAMSREKAED